MKPYALERREALSVLRDLQGVSLKTVLSALWLVLSDEESNCMVTIGEARPRRAAFAP